MIKLAKSVMGLMLAIQVMARGLGGRIGRNTSGRFVLTGAPSHPNTSRSCALNTQWGAKSRGAIPTVVLCCSRETEAEARISEEALLRSGCWLGRAVLTAELQSQSVGKPW